MADAPLANSDEARTATGEIKDQAPTASQPTTPTPTPPPEEPKTGVKAEEPKSLLNEKEPGSTVAPEKYEFKLPEGFELDETVAGEVQTLFKDIGLDQANAQKLVDFYSRQSLQAAEAPFKLWADTQANWVKEIKADKDLGGKLPEVKSTISRAIDGLGDPKLAGEFRQAMDITGAGNNPAFIRAFFKLAQQVTEGRHVAGRGPSAAGQANPASAPRSAGEALYPNLAKS